MFVCLFNLPFKTLSSALFFPLLFEGVFFLNFSVGELFFCGGIKYIGGGGIAVLSQLPSLYTHNKNILSQPIWRE